MTRPATEEERGASTREPNGFRRHKRKEADGSPFAVRYPRRTFLVVLRTGFGTASVRAGTTRVDLLPGQELIVGLGVTATSPDELDGATAFPWTNCGSADPSLFEAVRMDPVPPSDGFQRAFQATFSPAFPGTLSRPPSST
jgi:hypothetical protein